MKVDSESEEVLDNFDEENYDQELEEEVESSKKKFSKLKKKSEENI